MIDIRGHDVVGTLDLTVHGTPAVSVGVEVGADHLGLSINAFVHIQHLVYRQALNSPDVVSSPRSLILPILTQLMQVKVLSNVN